MGRWEPPLPGPLLHTFVEETEQKLSLGFLGGAAAPAYREFQMSLAGIRISIGVMNSLTNGADATGKGRGRLRKIGVLVLLLGLGGAGAVYWMGSPPVDLSSDPATARDYKMERRDIEINFGKMGLLMNEWMADLERPGTQAAMIALVSILVASGCFYFAQGPEGGGEPGADE